MNVIQFVLIKIGFF